MALKIDQKNSKEIIALNTFEAVRLRPTMYMLLCFHRYINKIIYSYESTIYL